MQNEALIKHLKKIGLSEKSSIIYATLIETGGCFPSRLAEITHINRSTVYKILLDLSIKGLVTEIEKGKKLFYQPENPDKLLRYTKMQAEIANDAYEKTQELMPDIEGIFAMNPNKPKIRYFQNAEGIASIYEDMVSGKDKYEMISFSHGQAFKNFLPAKDLYKFVKAKESLGITTKAIIPDTPENKKYNEEVFDSLLGYIPRQLAAGYDRLVL